MRIEKPFCGFVWNDMGDHVCRRSSRHTWHLCPCGALHCEPTVTAPDGVLIDARGEVTS